MSIAGLIARLGKIFDPYETAKPLYQMPQTKPDFHCRTGKNLPTCQPHEVGVSPDLLAEFIHLLWQDETLNMHRILVVKDGKKILDHSFFGEDGGVWKYTYSACKSLVSLVVGVLCDRGLMRLDDHVEDYFEKNELSAIQKWRMRDLTIRRLLTMSVGSSFNEIGIIAKEDWLQGFLSGPIKAESDQLFSYNSMNTYFLSVLIRKASGMTLMEALKEFFFDPMGITDYHFDTCPKGIEMGGWGLYLCPEDLAKFGLLFLDGGVWEGKRLISKEYLDLATEHHRKTPDSYGDFDYGLHMWVGKTRRTVLFNGMHGQNLLIDLKNRMVILSHAGNDEMFQRSNYFDHVNRCFLDREFPSSIRKSKAAIRRLAKVRARAIPRKSAALISPKALFCALSHRVRPHLVPILPLFDGELVSEDGKTASMGIFPRMLQITRGRYTSGLDSIGISVGKGGLLLSFNEKEQKHQLLLSNGVPCRGKLSFGKENYLCLSSYRVTRDENGDAVLLIRIDLIETPYSRLIRIRLRKGGGIDLTLDEKPGCNFVTDLYQTLMQPLMEKPIIGAALGKVEKDYPEFLVRRVLNPTIAMKRREGITS